MLRIKRSDPDASQGAFSQAACRKASSQCQPRNFPLWLAPRPALKTMDQPYVSSTKPCQEDGLWKSSTNLVVTRNSLRMPRPEGRG